MGEYKHLNAMDKWELQKLRDLGMSYDAIADMTQWGRATIVRHFTTGIDEGKQYLNILDRHARLVGMSSGNYRSLCMARGDEQYDGHELHGDHYDPTSQCMFASEEEKFYSDLYARIDEQSEKEAME